ncbi:PolC-type DNA polymerase III [Thermanaerosceptrum fracticalcis]|uniref:DNA polymerase III PolC-type n=1 Tax=Thermanaerosceptrum fracticalcis TaxID=1712410 RepID=A0A7G6E0X4_THEFR|nr:PolC-type DNA polymerase III [Thermanaerosceptrum fracticalcis]QNB45728.1 PolC-type DNA polymerase III [Thermanaerosceptrum fracticalcis]
MALVQEKHNNPQWHIFLESLDVPSVLKQYLSQCSIKKIIVSQAENAWEIYFGCPKLPEAEELKLLTGAWQKYFHLNQSPKMYFQLNHTYPDLETLCQQCWQEIVDKLTVKIPSIRGWLAGAVYAISGRLLQIKINQEIGWLYLNNRHIKREIEQILENEYNIKADVELVLEENGDTNDEECLWEIEKLYQEKLREAVAQQETSKPKKEQLEENNVIFGKKISGEAVPLKDIVEEEKNIIVKGYVFGLEIRELKTGRLLISFNISDKTDSLSCKIIADPTEAAGVRERLEENKWYMLRGTVQIDRFTQELTLMPRDIMGIVPTLRMDTYPEKRVELHLHTRMSTLDAVAGIKEIINRAAAWGHPALAITDHGNVQAFPEAYEEAKGKNIRIIFGVEGYLFDDSNVESAGRGPTYHCVILAINQEGLRNLYELVTISHLDFYHRVPRIPKSKLQALRQGLLIGSACEAGELIQQYLKGASTEELERLAEFYDYLEIQPRGNNRFLVENGTFTSEDDLLKMNAFIYQLGQKLNKPVVATGDVHFLDPEDEVYRRILMAGKGFEDADNQAPLYLKTTEEMLEEFSYLGEGGAREVVIDNPQKIAALVEEIKPIPDEFYPPEIEGAEKEINHLTMTRAYELYGNPLPETVKKRVEKELNSIIGNGFAVLYLIAHKLVKKSNEDGYLVGSRGSVGSSLVATFCGITEVNPLPPHYRCGKCHYSEFIQDGSVGSGADLPDKNCPRCQTKLTKDGHDIPFEVFLGFKGDKVPDIDLNFSGEYQPRAHKYTEELFGKDNVFRAGTIATIANKTAFGFVKNYFQEKNINVRNAEIARLVEGCTGVKRTTGQHPGGVMVLPKGLDIHRFTPLQRPADDVRSDTITTHFDYHSISSRLVKLDILGHDDPTVIKMLEDLTGIDCKTIPLDEPKVLSLFHSTEALGVDPKELGSNVGTLGIPEFGTKFVRQMLEDTNPQTFSDLVRISGFSHGTDVWLNNAQDLIKSGIAKVSEVISARDDIMTYLIYKGVEPSKAFKIMEGVRKGKGVKPEDVEVMKSQKVPDWYIESCQKIKYMFPKAHAVAYVMMAFRIAYFKVYYPAAFYASFFSIRADEFDADIIVGGIPMIKRVMEEITKKGNEASAKEAKLYNILELALEMYLRGITIKKVDLRCSDSTRFLIVDDGKALLPPLVSLQGVGEAAALSIAKAREEKAFTSREDLRIRGKVSKTVIEVLDNHGSLDDLPENDQISLF